MSSHPSRGDMPAPGFAKPGLAELVGSRRYWLKLGLEEAVKVVFKHSAPFVYAAHFVGARGFACPRPYGYGCAICDAGTPWRHRFVWEVRVLAPELNQARLLELGSGQYEQLYPLIESDELPAYEVVIRKGSRHNSRLQIVSTQRAGRHNTLPGMTSFDIAEEVRASSEPAWKQVAYQRASMTLVDGVA